MPYKKPTERSDKEWQAYNYWWDNPVEAVKDWFKVTPDDWQGDVLTAIFGKGTQDRVAGSLRLEVLARQVGVPQAARDGAPGSGEQQDATGGQGGFEQPQELIPSRPVHVGQKRAAPDQVERVTQLHVLRALLPVDGPRAERLGAEVDAVAVDVAGGQPGIRVLGPQDPRHAAIRHGHFFGVVRR